MGFNPNDMRVRFAELTAQREKITAVSGPLREKRDAFVKEMRAKEDAMSAEIKTAEEGLFDIDQERAMIARALGGKTAMPAEPAAE